MGRAPQHCRREPSMPHIAVLEPARIAGPLDVTETEGNRHSGATKPGDEAAGELLVGDESEHRSRQLSATAVAGNRSLAARRELSPNT